jgi:hypothetical protein
MQVLTTLEVTSLLLSVFITRYGRRRLVLACRPEERATARILCIDYSAIKVVTA